MNPSLPRLALIVLVVLAGTAWTVTAYLDALHADPLGPLAQVEGEAESNPTPADGPGRAAAPAECVVECAVGVLGGRFDVQTEVERRERDEH